MLVSEKLYTGEMLEDCFDEHVKTAIWEYCKNLDLVSSWSAITLLPQSLGDFAPVQTTSDGSDKKSGVAYFSAVAGADIKIIEGPMPKNFYGYEFQWGMFYQDENGEAVRCLLLDKPKTVKKIGFSASLTFYEWICEGADIEMQVHLWEDLFRENIMNRYINDGREHKTDWRGSFPWNERRRNFPMW